MRAYRNDLSVYIDNHEVYYIAFPKFTGTHCQYDTLCDHQRQGIDGALVVAEEVVGRFLKDGRENATGDELKKAFTRSLEVSSQESVRV